MSNIIVSYLTLQMLAAAESTDATSADQDEPALHAISSWSALFAF
jgi:hypothetical protein